MNKIQSGLALTLVALWWPFQLRTSEPEVTKFAEAAASAYLADHALPQLSFIFPGATLEDANEAQKQHVKRLLSKEIIAGFKGAAVGEIAQSKLGISAPLSAVLFQSSWLESKSQPVLKIKSDVIPAIETELGLILAETISEPVADIESLKQKVEAIVPVVELPASKLAWPNPVSAVDLTAINVGSDHYIVGERHTELDLDLDDLAIQLQTDGKTLNDTSGSAAHRGQWWNFLYQINHAIAQGYHLRSGQLVITGALGTIIRDGAGDYRASFGELGTIEFSLIME